MAGSLDILESLLDAGERFRLTLFGFGSKSLKNMDLSPFLSSLFLEPYITGLILTVHLMFFSYLLSRVRFRKAMKSDNHNSPREIPVVPYWIPGLYHAYSLIDLAGYLSRLKIASIMTYLRDRFGTEKPLLVKAGWFRFFIFTNPEHIKSIYRNSKKMTNKSTTLLALRRLFNLPADAASFYVADDSGLAVMPRKGCQTIPENRINFLIAHNIRVFLSSTHLEALNTQYSFFLSQELNALAIKDDWVAVPDLFSFIEELALKPSVESLVGSKLCELNKSFIDDLKVFQSHVPDFFRPFSRWIVPGAYQARERLLEGVKRWHTYCHQHSDYSTVLPDDPEWEPFFGAKLIKIRQQYSLKLKHMTADTQATEDLGLIFASTTNVTTSTFWFILETLRDPELMKNLEEEVSQCRLSTGRGIDVDALTSQPLLQSTYAEVLRLYLAGVASRIAEYEDITIAGYTIPKDSYLLMYTRTSALDYEAWNRAGRTLKKPLEEFDAERFLVDKDWKRPGSRKFGDVEIKPLRESTFSAAKTKPERLFSLDGLLGLWIPYGGGDHICPGRHFAKRQILLTFAMLILNFDVELNHAAQADVTPNMKYAPFGALPPEGKCAFRIRRKS